MSSDRTPADVIAVGICRRCNQSGEMANHGAVCRPCSDGEGWVRRTFTVWIDERAFGSSPDDDEIAYTLRMGGIDAETMQEHGDAAAGFRVVPEPDDTTRAAIKPFYAIQRADGDLIYSELGWLGVAGPDDWSYVEDDDPDPPTTYEMVRMQGEVVARRIFGTLMCDCPDADCVRCDGGVIDLGKLPYDAAAPYLSGDREGRPDTCPTCGTDCEQFGRCPDPWHGVSQ